MARAPDYAALRMVGRTLVSPRALYDFAFGWFAPAGFPHVVAQLDFSVPNQMRLRGRLPEPYAPCEAFFILSEGTIAALPEAVGHGPATIVESRVTPRSMDLVVAWPATDSVLTRLGRRVGAMLGAGPMNAAFETQRKQLSEAMGSLVRARDELRVVLDRLPDLVLVHRMGTVVWVNRAVIDALGYGHLDDIVGLQVLDLVADRSRQHLTDWMSSAQGTGDPHALLELWVRARDGSEFLCEASSAQEVTFDGAVCRLVVGRDVTERVRVQQRLVTADRLASVGLLAAGVAHEMNNPLAYVLVNIEMARKDVVALGAPGARARQALTTALEGVDRMRTIVKDLLVLSRGEMVAAVPTNVAAVVDSTLVLAAEEIRKKAQLVRRDVPAPLALASDARIAQVVLNLVSNALQALPDGAADEHRLVVETAPTDDGRVAIEIQDDGPGIAPDHLERVFEPFFTTKTEGRGTGLGLPITQRLVVELGGEITVTSPAEGGTVVRVLIPAFVPDEPQPSPGLVTAQASRAS
jgi:PAS domain S-box-containing protein